MLVWGNSVEALIIDVPWDPWHFIAQPDAIERPGWVPVAGRDNNCENTAVSFESRLSCGHLMGDEYGGYLPRPSSVALPGSTQLMLKGFATHPDKASTLCNTTWLIGDRILLSISSVVF